MFKPFTLPGRVRFYAGPGQLPHCELTAPAGQVVLCLQGAQVLSYIPTGQPDLLWISPNTQYIQGKAIRGGIPVCWPWFGDHPEDGNLPAHGFARNALWEIRSSFAADDTTQIQLGLTESATTRQIWPTPFDLTLDIELGHTLKLTLTTRNTGPQSVMVTEALHSYFAVSSTDSIHIEGLSGCRYHDKLEAFAIKPQREELTPTPPLDRVYDHSASGLKLLDYGLKRVIQIDKSASDSTIVWNPGTEVAGGIGDIGAEPSRRYICIESGNALGSAVSLPPGASHALVMELSSAALEE
ncbi:D-hexose-6-phosphate mutarotase [Marinobacterium zhoushanense]|uniref:Putative glucose-6-phosphate 1-epimerase n=1 Tax=Marinobacterium zhoushanense TaxID=1679163 RepID=A0ABQ1KK84_9GAMM|nr:D-hexose-6-phosphate mutarotase [Marinobacterium zhoushanense]GGB97153.1 D-hexose-6-phosphate mutarotase [Marinobacterium zhoushanense]